MASASLTAWHQSAHDKAEEERTAGGTCATRSTTRGEKGVISIFRDEDAVAAKNLLDDVYGKTASSKLLKKLSPGDLIFWGGTWKSGHRVSHVMLYMGYDPANDKHYVFGARSKSTTGLTGAGVDIFELDTERGRLVAHGKVPGLVYE